MCKSNHCWINTYNISICIVATKTLCELLPQTGCESGGGFLNGRGGGHSGGPQNFMKREKRVSANA